MLIYEFEEQVKEALSEMEKRGLKRALGSVIVEYKVPLALAGLAAGLTVAEAPLELGSMLGAAAGYVSIQITARGAGFLGKEGRVEPLAYLSLGARSFQLDPPPSTQ